MGKIDQPKWVNQIVLFIIVALIILGIFNFFCKGICKDKLTIMELEEKCLEQGLEFQYYTVYPSENSVKVGCMKPEFNIYKELTLNGS